MPDRNPTHVSTLLTLFISISRPPADAILCLPNTVLRSFSTKPLDAHNRMKTEQIGCYFAFYKCGLWSFFEVWIHAIIIMYT
jgi:hypothetical protein